MNCNQLEGGECGRKDIWREQRAGWWGGWGGVMGLDAGGGRARGDGDVGEGFGWV
jgi:hypothetical protein